MLGIVVTEYFLHVSWENWCSKMAVCFLLRYSLIWFLIRQSDCNVSHTSFSVVSVSVIWDKQCLVLYVHCVPFTIRCFQLNSLASEKVCATFSNNFEWQIKSLNWCLLISIVMA